MNRRKFIKQGALFVPAAIAFPNIVRGQIGPVPPPPLVSSKKAAAGGGGSFSPSDISGLRLWLKADAIVGLNDGDAVATWEDSSSQNNDGTQSNAARRPVYKTNILNGKPVVRMDATDDGLETAYSFAQPFTLFIVYNCSTAASNSFRAIQGDSANWLVGPYAGAHKLYNGAFINGPSVSANAFVIACAKSSTGDAKFYVDGSLIGSNSNNTAPGPIIIAYPQDIANPPYGEPLSGDIAEIIGYDSALSDSDRGNVQSYLETKYAL